MREELIAKYKEFLEKLDAKVASIVEANRAKINCKLGCNSCCKSGLTVGWIEALLIKDHFDSLVAAKKSEIIKELGAMGSSHCEFLQSNGGCAIYESRPVVCRTQGVPNRLLDASTGSVEISICSLNYLNGETDDLKPGEIIDSDTVSLVKAAFNREVSLDNPGERFDLNSTIIFNEI